MRAASATVGVARKRKAAQPAQVVVVAVDAAEVVLQPPGQLVAAQRRST